MDWVVWAIGAILLLLVGASRIRAGKPKVVRVLAAMCAVFFVIWIFNLGALFGGSGSSVGIMLAVLAPGTALLAIWTTERDRRKVMGRPEERDMIATAAVVTAAHEIGTEHGGDSGHAGGGEF